ncbi:GntR family transcriptional regulator [Mycoplasmopsis cynos]|nr:GntR family transcriptional regulator [Mycoplasmopsis cynos]
MSKNVYEKNINSAVDIKNNIRVKQVKSNEDFTKTNNIILYLMDLIKSKKIPVNKIMPSENALMQRFNCSRSVVVVAYQRLSSLGAVYTISKRGHFVAENFHNLIKPVSLILKVEKQEGYEEIDFIWPEWFEKKNIIFTEGARKFKKTYYKNDELIAYSDIWISTKNIAKDEIIDASKPLIDVLDEKETITNIVYEVQYENFFNYFGFEKMMVLTLFDYDEDSICIAGKYYIKPEHFKLFYQEFSLL